MAKKETICAVILNGLGEILPYTCASTKEACEEHAKETIVAWNRLKDLGAKVVQCKIVLLEE